jgi:endonuclease/exonuclease/phosphatase family metal-dependent hydrolase
MRSLHKTLALAVTTLLLLSGQQLTAEASTPAGVETVSVKAATRTSLTIKWSRVRGADDYIVERGTDLDMSSRRVVLKTRGRTITISQLQQGALYCFQVRAVDGDRMGRRSRKVCQRTIAQEGTATGPVYRVVNYNICSSACANWNARRAAAAALVAATEPDVVMLQEAFPESGMARAIGRGMVQVQAKSGKALLYDSDRFALATPAGRRRTGWLDLGAVSPSSRGRRYAVWAELIDRASGQHVVFAGVHLTPGSSDADDAKRREEADRLVAGLRRVNPRGLPLVVAGDFNSHQGRKPDSPGAVMSSAGLANSYFRAHTWKRGKLNSANGMELVPRKGSAWGYHLDQVWAEPGRTQVLEWRNAAELVDGHYAAPLPSNHNPIMVELRVNP